MVDFSSIDTGCGISSYPREGSVLNFVSMPPCLILEAGCGQNPRILVNTGDFGNILCWK